ncbi:MAG: Fic family protein [Candidatus Gracilibacteria bacterium]|jgi:Fic family protein
MPPQFFHYNLELVQPDYESSLTDLIIELDYLRKKPLHGTTPAPIFFQLKSIFHTLESIGSARIEGNHTTIAEFIETKINQEANPTEEIVEIQNLEKAMSFIDEHIQETPMNRIFLSELHKHVVQNLVREGSQTPGEYRVKNLAITQSEHVPPDFIQVAPYMQELFDFINKNDSPKYDLLKTAISHHRFVWIHPFDNGNGRTVRLLTYAMLVKQGFNVNVGRIINPTAIFCSNRKQYYEALSWADRGTKEGVLRWCEYVLGGLKTEIEKIDRLLDYEYLKKHILVPAVKYSLERKFITDIEAKILEVAIEKKILQASDVKKILPDKIPAEISRIIRRIKEKKMLQTENEKSRKYTMSFSNSYLLRGVIKMLDENNFLPMKE